MNCGLHLNNVAKYECEYCGNGICDDCFSHTNSYGKYCVPCAIKLISEDLRSAQSNNRLLKFETILLALTWIIGVVLVTAGALLIHDNLMLGVILIVIGALTTGLATGISAWKLTKESNEELNENSSVHYQALMAGDGWWHDIFLQSIAFLVGLVLGFLISPIKLIINFIKLKRMRNEISFYNRMLNDLREYRSKNTMH